VPARRREPAHQQAFGSSRRTAAAAGRIGTRFDAADHLFAAVVAAYAGTVRLPGQRLVRSFSAMFRGAADCPDLASVMAPE